jgi:hypothetical protein
LNTGAQKCTVLGPVSEFKNLVNLDACAAEDAMLIDLLQKMKLGSKYAKDVSRNFSSAFSHFCFVYTKLHLYHTGPVEIFQF